MTTDLDIEQRINQIEKNIVVLAESSRVFVETFHRIVTATDIIRTSVKQQQAEINELKRRIDQKQ